MTSNISTEYSFYYLETGMFLGKTWYGPMQLLYLNTPLSCGAMEGCFDYLSQRVDVESGEVVNYQPSPPSENHEWDEAIKRWQLNAEAQKEYLDDRVARGELIQLDMQLIRYLAEDQAGILDQEGERRVSAIIARKAALRAKLKK